MRNVVFVIRECPDNSKDFAIDSFDANSYALQERVPVRTISSIYPHSV